MGVEIVFKHKQSIWPNHHIDTIQLVNNNIIRLLFIGVISLHFMGEYICSLHGYGSCRRTRQSCFAQTTNYLSFTPYEKAPKITLALFLC